MIRTATMDDIDDLLWVEHKAFSPSYGEWQRKQFYNLIKYGKGLFFVDYQLHSILDHSVFGYIYVTPQGRILSIASLINRGALLLKTAEHAHTGTNLHLETPFTNKRAIRFYVKHGFIKTGIMPHYYKPGLHAFCFRKELKKNEVSHTV